MILSSLWHQFVFLLMHAVKYSVHNVLTDTERCLLPQLQSHCALVASTYRVLHHVITVSHFTAVSITTCVSSEKFWLETIGTYNIGRKVQFRLKGNSYHWAKWDNHAMRVQPLQSYKLCVSASTIFLINICLEATS